MIHNLWYRASEEIVDLITGDELLFSRIKEKIREDVAKSTSDILVHYQERTGDLVGTYIPSSDGLPTIVIHVSNCVEYIKALIAFDLLHIESPDDLRALSRCITLSGYIHAHFHFFSDIVRSLYPVKTEDIELIEEALATAFEYRFFYGDIETMYFSKNGSMVPHWFTVYDVPGDNDFGAVHEFRNGYWPKTENLIEKFKSIIPIMPYYSIDDNKHNGDVFEWYRAFIKKNGQAFITEQYSKLSSPGYKDWHMYSRHYDFLSGLKELLAPKTKYPNGIELLLFAMLRSVFIMDKKEVVV